MNEHDVGGYVSMPCALYGSLELAIMRGRHQRVAWRGEDGSRFVGRLQPLDLETESGAEFLLAALPDGTRVRLRLDHIVEFHDL